MSAGENEQRLEVEVRPENRRCSTPGSRRVLIHAVWIARACAALTLRFDLMTEVGVPPERHHHPPQTRQLRAGRWHTPQNDLIAVVPLTAPVGLRVICTMLAGFRSFCPERYVRRPFDDLHAHRLRVRDRPRRRDSRRRSGGDVQERVTPPVHRPDDGVHRVRDPVRVPGRVGVRHPRGFPVRRSAAGAWWRWRSSSCAGSGSPPTPSR